MKKCIITVVGKDTVGIIAKVCTYLAENKNSIIPDISKKPEDLGVQDLDIKNNTSETNKQDYYTTINDNLSKTLINMSASVAFKKTHAEQMIS